MATIDDVRPFDQITQKPIYGKAIHVRRMFIRWSHVLNWLPLSSYFFRSFGMQNEWLTYAECQQSSPLTFHFDFHVFEHFGQALRQVLPDLFCSFAMFGQIIRQGIFQSCTLTTNGGEKDLLVSSDHYTANIRASHNTKCSKIHNSIALAFYCSAICVCDSSEIR